MITNPLNDIVPAKYRKQVYALLALASIVFAVYKASNGDWTEFVGGLFATLVGSTAASNTDSSPDNLNADHAPEPDGAEDEYDES